MKKMYIFTVFLIVIIAVCFLIFVKDTETLNNLFLSAYHIKTSRSPLYYEEFTIPSEFDRTYDEYNMMQTEAGLDLLPHAGKKAVRYTYTVLNFPSEDTVYANVICVHGKPIAGDITCPSLNGFTLPLNYLISSK